MMMFLGWVVSEARAVSVARVVPILSVAEMY